MKGIQVIRSSEVVYRNDLPVPQPSPSQLLVRIVAAAVNPSDIMNAAGKFPNTTFPRIPGRDFSGLVIAAPTSSTISVGSEVYGTSGKNLSFTEDGAHAEYMLVPVDGVAVKPKSLSFAQAAAVGTPFTTAMLALKRTGVKKGETVLVLGASGAVGSAVSQIATAMGCEVIDAARRDNFAVNLKSDPELQTIRGLTGGKGVNICIDTVGNVPLIRAALQSALAIDGRLAIITVTGAEQTLDLDLRSLYRAQNSIVGCNSAESSIQVMGSSLGEMNQWFEGGNLTPPGEETLSTTTIENLKDVYDEMMAGKLKGKKFVVVFEAAKKGN